MQCALTEQSPVSTIRDGPMADPAVIPGAAGAAEASREASLRRQLQREQEARRLAEHLAGQGIDSVLRELRELMLLGRVAVAANEATSLSAAAEECLSLVARHAGWPGATLWVRDAFGLDLHPTGTWFNDSGVSFEELAEAVSSRLTVPSGSLPGVVAMSGAPAWLDGLRNRSNWLRDDHDCELGVSSALAVPLWAGREIVGVVALFHDDDVPRCDRLLELLEQVVTQLGVAVRRLNEPDVAQLPPTKNGLDLRACVSPPDLSTGQARDLAAVAHQVRTPLHSIIGNLELLCESSLDREQRDLGAVALQSAVDLHLCLERWMRPTPAPGS